MKLRNKILLFVCLLGASLFNVAHTIDINYKHKSLVRVLKKSGITDMSTIKEIAVQDSIMKKYRIKGKYFVVNAQNKNEYKYIYVGRVNSCRTGGCSISNDMSKEGESEYFDYYILYDKYKTVQAVKVFNYQATHGHEITAKGWLKQFIGYNGTESLQVDKNIDAISGATISVYAITFDIELKTEVLGII